MTRARRDIGTDFGLVLLAVIWGVNFSVLKLVLDDFDPLALNALRFPLASAALSVFLWSRRPRIRPDRSDVPRLIALGIAGNVAYQLCFIIGIDWTRAGNASLLLSTTPVWTVILSRLAGHEVPSRGVVLGVIATLVGMAFVVAGGSQEVSLGSATLRGDLLMILASILWSAYTVAGARPVARYGALQMTVWTLWIGTPVIVLMGLPSLLRMDLGAVPLAAWVGVIYSGLLAIGLAYLLWYHGVQKLGNNRTAVYSNLVPVAALATAWLWLGEVPTALQLMGAAVILGGLTVARIAQSPGPSSRRYTISGNS